MLIEKPKTAEAYVRLVDQAIIETEELRASYEYDLEDIGRHLAYLEPLEAGLKRLRHSMADGSYAFEERDLPFMAVADKYREQIPFTRLLVIINDTHRTGLNVEAD